jgi:hypothetical protein
MQAYPPNKGICMHRPHAFCGPFKSQAGAAVCVLNQCHGRPGERLASAVHMTVRYLLGTCLYMLASSNEQSSLHMMTMASWNHSTGTPPCTCLSVLPAAASSWHVANQSRRSCVQAAASMLSAFWHCVRRPCYNDPRPKLADEAQLSAQRCECQGASSVGNYAAQ